MGKLIRGSQPEIGSYPRYENRKNGKKVLISTLVGMVLIILVGVIVAVVVDRNNKAKLVQSIMNDSAEPEAPSDPMLIKIATDVQNSEEYDALKQAILLMGPNLTQQSQITPEIVVGILENAFVASRDNNGSFAGMTFETGEAETPVAITYGEIYAGTMAPYFCTDAKALEDMISGYCGECYELSGPMIAYPEILNDGEKVTEWGEGYTQSATGITDAEIISMQQIDDEMVVKARLKDSTDDASWVMNFKKNKDSIFGYSLTSGITLQGSMGITQVHATHADCVYAAEAILQRVASGELSVVTVAAGEGDCAWTRDYYYDENDNLVCAFMHDATDGSEDQRMVLVDEYMILWSVGKEQAMVSTDSSQQTGRIRDYYVSEAGGNVNFENWQKFILADYRSHRVYN